MGRRDAPPERQHPYIARRKEICAGLQWIGGRYTADIPALCVNAPAECECTRGISLPCRVSPACQPLERSFRLCAFQRSSFRWCMNDFGFKLRQEHCLVALRAGGDHADLCSALALDETQIFLRLLRQIVKAGRAFS